MSFSLHLPNLMKMTVEKSERAVPRAHKTADRQHMCLKDSGGEGGAEEAAGEGKWALPLKGLDPRTQGSGQLSLEESH